MVTKVTADFDRWTLMQANEPLIVQLQARWRGNLVRQPYQERLSYLRSHQDEAVRLQAYWKGFKQRKAYQERLEFLKKQAAVVVRVSLSVVSYSQINMADLDGDAHRILKMIIELMYFFADSSYCQDVESKKNIYPEKGIFQGTRKRR